MAMDLDAVKAGLPAAVPMVRTLGLEFVSLEPTRAVLVLHDQEAYRNHVGGPHAGAMFTLAESASGALVLANFGDLLDRATPLAVDATIRYAKLALGDVTATAELTRPAEDVRAELAAGERPEFGVEVTLANADGVVTGTMSIRWTLKPNAR
jgi:acyl-coenzyme A thioesterase PaaI-like protein